MRCIRKYKIGILTLLIVCFPSLSHAQSASYISVAYIKSTADNFLDNEKKYWVPIHQQLIKEGKKQAWVLYKVKYPEGAHADYNYVRLNVLTDWSHVEDPYAGLNSVIKKVHPKLNAKKFYKATNASRKLIWTQLYRLIGEAREKPGKPPAYIVSNEMKVVAGSEARYRELELGYFKPFHIERVKAGLMNNWQLLQTAMPYGEKYTTDYVTFNGFDSWAAINKNNPPDMWQRAHGDTDFDTIHDEIRMRRLTVNNEIWELVAYAM